MADQFGNQTQRALDSFAYYGLLAACLTAALVLLFSSLLLLLDYPSAKRVQPELRLMRSNPTRQLPNHPTASCIAQANRNRFRLRAAQIRAGEFSN